MKKKFLPTLIAFIILVGLLLYANKYEVDEILPNGELPQINVLGINDSQIKSLSIGKVGSYSVKLVKANEDFKIVFPAEYDCDNAEAYNLAGGLCGLVTDNYIDDNTSDVSAFGINDDSLAIKIETDKEPIELRLGAKVPVDDSFYLMKSNEQRLYVVKSETLSYFTKGLNDLRERALYHKDFGICNEITYKTSSETLILSRDAKNNDWVIKNTKYSADNEEVANLLNSMRNLRVSKFVDYSLDDADKYGLSSPSVFIDVVTEYMEHFVLEVGNMQGSDVYVKDNAHNNIQMVRNTSVNPLRLGLNELREKFLSLPLFDDIVGIEITDATGTLTVEHVEKNWKLGEVSLNEADVKDFLNSMVRTKVTAFEPLHDLEEYCLTPEQKPMKISIISKDEVQNYWVGLRKGLSLTIMTETELIDINAELDEAIKKFLYRLRRD